MMDTMATRFLHGGTCGPRVCGQDWRAPLLPWRATVSHRDLKVDRTQAPKKALRSWRSWTGSAAAATVVMRWRYRPSVRQARPIDDDDVRLATAVPRRASFITRLRSGLLAARRRWGLALVRGVVSVVVRLELMAAKDSKVAASLITDTLEATRKGILDFTGRKEYQFGDITKVAVSKFAEETMSRVHEYTGKDDYEFGDITKASVSKFTGKEHYEFGDITKATASKVSDATSTAVKQITGKDEYKFGDITKSVFAKIAGKEGPDDGDQKSDV